MTDSCFFFKLPRKFCPRFTRMLLLAVKPCIGKEAQAWVSAAISRRKKERENAACCVCERDIVA